VSTLPKRLIKGYVKNILNKDNKSLNLNNNSAVLKTRIRRIYFNTRSKYHSSFFLYFLIKREYIILGLGPVEV
jgi:hypothetical protein